jgi:hypothetical protein
MQSGQSLRWLNPIEQRLHRNRPQPSQIVSARLFAWKKQLDSPGSQAIIKLVSDGIAMAGKAVVITGIEQFGQAWN